MSAAVRLVEKRFEQDITPREKLKATLGAASPKVGHRYRLPSGRVVLVLGQLRDGVSCRYVDDRLGLGDVVLARAFLIQYATEVRFEPALGRR